MSERAAVRGQTFTPPTHTFIYFFCSFRTLPPNLILTSKMTHDPHLPLFNLSCSSLSQLSGFFPVITVYISMQRCLDGLPPTLEPASTISGPRAECNAFLALKCQQDLTGFILRTRSKLTPLLPRRQLLYLFIQFKSVLICRVPHAVISLNKLYSSS